MCVLYVLLNTSYLLNDFAQQFHPPVAERQTCSRKRKQQIGLLTSRITVEGLIILIHEGLTDSRLSVALRRVSISDVATESSVNPAGVVLFAGKTV